MGCLSFELDERRYNPVRRLFAKLKGPQRPRNDPAMRYGIVLVFCSAASHHTNVKSIFEMPITSQPDAPAPEQIVINRTHL